MSRGPHHLDFPSYIPHQAKPAGQHTGRGGGEGGTKRFSFESNRDWRRRGEVSLKCCRSEFGSPSDHNSWVMLARYHFHFSDIILDISLSLFI